MIADLDLVDDAAAIVAGEMAAPADLVPHLEALLAYCESLRVSLNECHGVIAQLLKNGYQAREHGPRRITTPATLMGDLAESLRLRLAEGMKS